MGLRELVEIAGDATEATGILMIVGGVILASLRAAVPAAAQAPSRYRRYRLDLGHAIVLGLEVLVAADIIRTVAFSPSMDSMAALAAIVVIRTFLSWSLAVELEGRWPWQRAAQAQELPSSIERRMP